MKSHACIWGKMNSMTHLKTIPRRIEFACFLWRLAVSFVFGPCGKKHGTPWGIHFGTLTKPRQMIYSRYPLCLKEWNIEETRCSMLGPLHAQDVWSNNTHVFPGIFRYPLPLSLYLEGFGMKDRTNCGIHFGSTTHPRCLMEKIHMSSLEAFGILSLCLWGVGMKYRFNKPRELCWLATRTHASPHGLLQRLQGSQIAASTWSIDGLRTPTELVDPLAEILYYYIYFSSG